MKSKMEHEDDTVTVDWPIAGLEQVENCPACGSAQRRQLYVGLTDRVFHCAPGRWDLYQCKGCRSAYLDPRPTPSTNHLAYQHYYTHEPSQRQGTEGLPTWRWYVRALANGYRNRRYGSQLKPASSFGPWIMPLFPRLRQALDRELRYLPPVKPGSRMLDVGFGSGHFLILAQRVGWQVSGADPDPVAVANARKAGLDVRQGNIETFEDLLEQFDVITLNHVIEHVHDPIKTLKQAYDLLKPGGWLYIDTPNIDAYGHQHFKEHWRGLEVPRHLVIFNWASIENLLNKVGFDELRQIQRFAPYAALAASSRSIQHEVDPYTVKMPRTVDVINEMIFKWNPFSNKKRTEFITVIAIKT